MDNDSIQNGLNEGDTENHSHNLISYSRLADEIDRQDEENKRNNINYNPINQRMLSADNHHIIQPMIQMMFEREEKDEQDDPAIIIHKVQNFKETQEDEQKKINRYQSNLTKGLYLSEPPQRTNVEIKPIVYSNLRPIIQNQNQNKRSDEEPQEQQQSIIQSQICKHIKIASMYSMNNSNKPNQQKKSPILRGGNAISNTQLNNCNIRVQNSIDLQEDDEKVVTANAKIEQQNQNKRSKLSRTTKQLDKRVFSSKTTASKIAAMKIQPKVEEKNIQDNLTAFMKRLSKVEATIISINERKRNGSQMNAQSGSMQNNHSKARSKQISQKITDAKNLTQNKLLIFRSLKMLPEVKSIEKQRKNRISLNYFSNKQLDSMLKQQFWIWLLSVDTNDNIQLNRGLSYVSKLFNLQRGYKIHSKEPLVVELQNNQILLLSYTKKIYFGQCRYDKGCFIKNGFGVQIDPLRSIFQGYFSQGIKEGQGKYLLKDKYEYEGQWKKGVIEGKGSLHLFGKSSYMGEFINGKKHGYGVEDFQSGDKYEGQFQNNAFHGKGSYYWRNGAKYKGHFMNDQMHGIGQWVSSKGDHYKGNFANSKKQGWGVYSWKNGRKYEGQFINGSRKNLQIASSHIKKDPCDISFVEKSTSPKRYKIVFNK